MKIYRKVTTTNPIANWPWGRYGPAPMLQDVLSRHWSIWKIATLNTKGVVQWEEVRKSGIVANIEFRLDSQ